MMHRFQLVLCTCILLVVFCFFEVPSVCAQEKDGISIDPPVQEILLGAETAATSTTILVRNTSPVVQHVSLKAINFEQIDAQGNIRFADKPTTGEHFTLARFISFPESTFDVAAHETKVLTATITNSIDLSPGTHYGAALFQFTPQTDNTQTQIIPAVSSILILKKLGGEVYRINVRSVTGLPSLVSLKHPSELSLEFENAGNTHITPRGTVTGYGLGNRLVFKGIINEGSTLVLPEHRRVISLHTYHTQRALPFDFITVKIEGTAQGTQEQYFSSSTYIYCDPWVLGAFLIVLVVSYLGWRRFARHAHAH